MSEYVHRVYKEQQAGNFTQDPPQDVSNAGQSILDRSLSIKDAAIIGVAATQAKRVFGTGYSTLVDFTGDSTLEKRLDVLSTGLEYGALILVDAKLAAAKAFGDVITYGIETAVNAYNQNLENAIKRNDRGTRVKYNTGGYYG